MPTFNANPEGGVFLITSSVAVRETPSIVERALISMSRAFITLGVLLFLTRSRKLQVMLLAALAWSALPSIVNLSSGLHLMKCMATTQGPKLRINSILPGFLLTDWVRPACMGHPVFDDDGG